MSVTVNDLKNGGIVKPEAQNPTHGASGESAGQTDVFQALLTFLKSDQAGTPATSLRNRPASSQVIDRNGAPAATSRGALLNTQTVNTLATSALIALTAVSSGAPGLKALCGQGAGIPAGVAGLLPDTAPVSQACTEVAGSSRGQEIGALSARFESGGLGPGVVGYDPTGGTSYGIYQISSRAGTMKLFIDYLSKSAPDIAQKLQAAGPANTGGRSGEMPRVWKQLGADDPVRFQKLQTNFIQQTLYLPTVQQISEKTGLDISKAPKALQEVLWSTAVQHGSKGAADIFTKAIASVQSNSDQFGVAKLIDTVYGIRATRFSSSGPGIRAAVKTRFREEGKIALSMLSSEVPNPNIGA
ncbi:MAG: hypothetical protein P4L43_14650 [Syntrophobacteraceae bacterium]|nr:hypothetical protein [Syntrophobacteraceae bacterium]